MQFCSILECYQIVLPKFNHRDGFVVLGTQHFFEAVLDQIWTSYLRFGHRNSILLHLVKLTTQLFSLRSRSHLLSLEFPFEIVLFRLVNQKLLLSYLRIENWISIFSDYLLHAVKKSNSVLFLLRFDRPDKMSQMTLFSNVRRLRFGDSFALLSRFLTVNSSSPWRIFRW